MLSNDGVKPLKLTLRPSASAAPDATLGTGWNVPLDHANCHGHVTGWWLNAYRGWWFTRTCPLIVMLVDDALLTGTLMAPMAAASYARLAASTSNANWTPPEPGCTSHATLPYGNPLLAVSSSPANARCRQNTSVFHSFLIRTKNSTMKEPKKTCKEFLSGSVFFRELMMSAGEHNGGVCVAPEGCRHRSDIHSSPIIMCGLWLCVGDGSCSRGGDDDAGGTIAARVGFLLSCSSCCCSSCCC